MDQSGWEIVNITSEYHIPICRCTPIAFCTSTGLEYIYYYSDNGHIYQLYRNGAVTTWSLTDISELANATEFIPIGNLVCWSVLGTDRIFFTTENGHVIELFCLHNVSYIWKAGWKAHDLNLKTYSCAAKVVNTNIDPVDPDHSLDNSLSGSLLEEEEFDFIQKSQIRNSPTKKDFYTLLTAAQTQQIRLAEKTNEQIMHLFSLVEKEVAISPRLNEGQKHTVTQNVWQLNDQFSKIITREMLLVQKLQDVKISNQHDHQTQTYHSELLHLQPEKLKVASELLEQLHNIPEYATYLCGHIGIGSTSQYVFYYGTDKSVYQLRWGWALPRPAQKNDQLSLRSTVDDNSYDIPDEAMKANSQPSTLMDWIKVMSNTISTSTAKLAEMSRTTPFWKATNISKRVSMPSVEVENEQVYDAFDLISTVIAQPASHCTPIGSHHLFYLTFPDCHIHEYYWTPMTSWKHRDITTDTKCPLAAPRGQICSYCNVVSLYHYIYYLDINGHVYELRQSLTSDTSWTCTNITELLKAQDVAIPQAKQLLLATTHPINKNFNAVAVYYLDSASHIIELTCHVKLLPNYKVTWTYVDLSIRQKLVGVIQSPVGGMSGYIKGFIESLSASTQSSISSAVSIVKGLTFGNKQPAEMDDAMESPPDKPKPASSSLYGVSSGSALFHSDENDLIDTSPSRSPMRPGFMSPTSVNRSRSSSNPQSAKQDVSQRLFMKLQEESNRLREQSQANEKLQEQIVQLQVQNKELNALQAQSKESADKQLESQLMQLKQQQEQEMERLKLLLEANEKEKVQTQEKLEAYLKQWEQEQREQQEKFRRLMMETEIYKEQLQAEANMRKQKEEETQKAMEEREKLLKKLKEDEEKVHVLTNGLGWEMYKKVNLQGGNDNNEEEECIICFEPKALIKLNPCGHRNVCEECFVAIAAKDNICPKCRTPVKSVVQ